MSTTPGAAPPCLPPLGAPRRLTQTRETRDATVQATDTDAATSRLSAVRAGYLTDPFVSHFTPPAARKYPLINRGTYVRTAALDALIARWLHTHGAGAQIVSLGAGSDTRFFRLAASDSGWGGVYHELDFPAVTRRKVATIESLAALRDLVGEDMVVDLDAGSLHSKRYHVHPLDLRALTPEAPLLPGMDPAAPTLVLSECCLIYLAPEEADAIVRWAGARFGGALGCVLYEPIGGDDAFGRVMVQNLAARGIVLKTLKRYSSRERQRERLRVLGFGGGQEAADVEWLWENWVTREERGRIAGLEMVDEVEEWVLLARHYCVAWGWRGGKGFGEGACQPA
ncbi:S-adenosyl-L-methionine-dependent methyltransferase [Geopyxis carbonaria]|nr:S-adenosyl-L-methionine-dependent methyltransferase [Geopyxis carbonaria]